MSKSPFTVLLKSFTLLYALAVIAVLTAVSLTGMLVTDFSHGYWLFLFSYFLLGTLHVYLLYAYRGSFGNFSAPLLYTVLIALAGAGLVVLLYHLVWDDIAKGWGIAASLVAFVVPVLIFRVYRAFAEIPPREYKKWYYPVGTDLPDLDLLDLSQVLVIQFEFTKKAGENAFTNFRAKAPVSMLFGELFFIFLNDYNDRNPESPVEYLNDSGAPYGWHFYKRSPWHRRDHYIDPDLTFRANGIVDNETIVAVRK